MNSSLHRAFSLPAATHEMYGAFSPDTSRLLSGGDGVEPEVRIWDVETGGSLRVFKGHKQPVSALFCNTCDTNWPPSKEEIAKFRKQFAKISS
jgi:WD40 repeat protein